MHNVLTFPTKRNFKTQIPFPIQLMPVNPFEAAMAHYDLLQLDRWKASTLLKAATKAERQGKYRKAIALRSAWHYVMLRLQRRHLEWLCESLV